MKTMSITALDADVLGQLKERLISSRFSDFELHAEWLRSLGYSISKSSVHRYAATYRDEVLLESSSPSKLVMMTIRVQCLEIASRLVGPELAVSKADELLFWVRRC